MLTCISTQRHSRRSFQGTLLIRVQLFTHELCCLSWQVYLSHILLNFILYHCYHEGSALHSNEQVQTKKLHGYTRVLAWPAMRDLSHDVWWSTILYKFYGSSSSSWQHLAAEQLLLLVDVCHALWSFNHSTTITSQPPPPALSLKLSRARPIRAGLLGFGICGCNDHQVKSFLIV